VRLRIEATPDELANKSESLIKALADAIGPAAPDLAEALKKALPKETVKLIQPALREMHEITRKEYEKRLKWMVKDIGKVLDRSLAKADPDIEKEPGEEEEKLEPGDINPETGEEVPEEEEEEEDEEEDEEEEEEET
jgi:hypothetical protein